MVVPIGAKRVLKNNEQVLKDSRIFWISDTIINKLLKLQFWPWRIEYSFSWLHSVHPSVVKSSKHKILKNLLIMSTSSCNNI